MKVRFTALLFCCYLIHASVFAQAPPIQFSKIFGGSREDIGNIIVQTSDKGFLIFGSTNSTDGQVVGVIDSQMNSYDLWAIKTDSAGNLLWAKTILGRASTPWAAAEVSNAYVVGGYTYGNTHDFAGFPSHNFPINYIAWLDKNDGHIMLARNYDELIPGMNSTYDLKYLDDGSFLAVGNVSGDCWVAKINTISGDTIWRKRYGGTLNDLGWSASVSDTAFYITGVTNSTNGDVTDNPGGPNGWVIKIDTAGQLLWSRTYDGDQYGWLTSMDRDPAGNLICGGKAWGGGTHRSGYHAMRDYWVVKLSPDGDTLWCRCYGGSDEDDFSWLKATNDGGAILCGITESSDGDISTPPSVSDFWIVRIDSNGAIVWDTTLGCTYADRPGAVTTTCDGGYAFTGLVTGVTKDVTGTAFGSFEVWLCKLAPDGLDNTYCPTELHAEESGALVKRVSIYPNPAENKVQIDLGQAPGGPISVLITDIAGKIISKHLLSAQVTTLDVSSLSKGLYFLNFPGSEIKQCVKLAID